MHARRRRTHTGASDYGGRGGCCGYGSGVSIFQEVTEETVTVDELIQLLAKHSLGLCMVVNGYENCYDGLSPDQLSVVGIALNTGKHRWNGGKEI